MIPKIRRDPAKRIDDLVAAVTAQVQRLSEIQEEFSATADRVSADVLELSRCDRRHDRFRKRPKNFADNGQEGCMTPWLTSVLAIGFIAAVIAGLV